MNYTISLWDSDGNCIMQTEIIADSKAEALRQLADQFPDELEGCQNIDIEE